jgi:hypothetical protein
MRYLLIGVALVSLSALGLGQNAYQETPDSDLRPPALRQSSRQPQTATGGGLVQPGAGLPFRNWQEVLAKSTSNAQRARALDDRAHGKTG